MPETLIGYARCSTDEQDLTAQQERLVELGISPERIYLDHGLTGTSRARPGLDQALAAVREGDTLVVPKLALPSRWLTCFLTVSRVTTSSSAMRGFGVPAAQLGAANRTEAVTRASSA